MFQDVNIFSITFVIAMKLKNIIFYVPFVAVFSSSIISAQSQQRDTSFIAASADNAIEIYHQKIKNASGLYNGPEYERYPFPFEEGNPWFAVKDSNRGSVVYDGVLYQGIFMKYDELKDVIVIWRDNDAIRLLSEKVSYFKLLGHSFIPLIKDNTGKNLVSTGFYDQMYAGKIVVFKKTIKSIRERTDITDGILRTIDQKTYFYLQTARGYIPVNSKADLSEALKDHKNEIREFIDSNNLNFKKDPSGFLVKVATYYDTL